MNRDEVHLRDRLLLLAECSNPHKPFNVKRKTTLTKQGSKSGPKLSVQDFVRMDPGYTPDIEHLVFPARKRNPQQVAPISTTGKARSRLAEMFALSRHLQQRSTDRDTKTRNPTVNRSIDSASAPPRPSDSRRWVSGSEEPVRGNSNTRISPVAESDMAAARGPNVSVLHLRSTSEPWEANPLYTTPKSTKTVPTLTKHQSLGGYKWSNSSNFHSVSEVNNFNSVNRELSPVRWCDREVDGVYLGRSGWVQVQQRSLDENRRVYQPPRRTGIKLSDYHFNSEPGEVTRPAHLSLNDRKKTPSPQPENFSPPPITPIISPPPAFQDKNKKGVTQTKTFFGKTPFLPRLNAVDSDEISPPPTPKAVKIKSMSMPSQIRKVNLGSGRIPQTKSMEDTTAARRLLFVQRHESSSSSSSSMGFRSLDSCVNRPTMPRLSENTDSSIDVYEDADEEDNNSSSINISMVNINIPKEKISPSTRPNRLQYYRSQLRKTPTVTESTKPPNCVSPGSSSSSSNEFLSRSPLGSSQQLRRVTPTRQYQPKLPQQEEQRVRRSRSLQLPDKKVTQNYPLRVSPQHPEIIPHRPNIKMGTQVKRHNKVESTLTEEDLRREAEIVSNFLYGTRTRAAAQALLMQRYNSMTKEDKEVQKPGTNSVGVYFVGKKERPKVLHRGSTTPNLPLPPKHIFGPQEPPKNPCTSDTCDFWPHCAHRESIMRSSQSYPTHQNKRPGKVPEKGSFGTVSSSSSSSDVWLTTSDRTVAKKSSGASTPEDLSSDKRPGSAPTEERSNGFLESQQRSMSLPKSFLSVSQQQGGQFPWRRRGTESLGSSPGLPRKLITQSSETSHTAPVTPLHEGSRRRSPLGGVGRRAKASSTPQLLEAPTSENRKWSENTEQTNETRVNTQTKEQTPRRNLPTTTSTESVLQKFRKTFSLRFHPKKSSNRDSCDLGEALSEMLASEEESQTKDEPSESKSRFGPLIWRSSKERKKLNKAARNAKCNSGDSGIQIEMMPGCGGADSSESHDTDPPGDDLDSPPTVRRRTLGKTASRPHSDLLNQILIDKFKSDLKQRSHRHNQVRRTRSDLGGQRLLQWDSRSSYKRLMSTTSPLRGRPQSPRKKPPDAPGGVQLRINHRRGQLRRSLSQPLDIDKLSPLMRTKTTGLKIGGSHVVSEDERVVTSDDEAMSDSESSIASLNERKKSLELAMDEEMVILAEAVFDHVAFESEELAFRAGDLIEVLETANREWWWGTCGGKSGWFPAQFVRLRVSQEDTVEDCLAAMASGHGIATQLRRRTSISLLSNDQVRTSVVKELLRTERDFVKVLEDVAEGYIAECRKRKDMFTDEQIGTIFINLEDILVFQANFVKDLEGQIDFEAPYKSCVGGCFLKNRAGFKMYSEYCNSHPTATAALQELYQYQHYSKFFEACRLMRGLIEIPLDGYLLTPVQRICKYPLQLAELLKYTRPDHKDYEDIKEALDAMRGVAVLINERKRRMESLEKLVAWQQRVEGWEGEDLIDSSTQLIHQGDAVKVTTGMWTNNITLFLFDHQIVYCKKDILKRNTYVYKGRICLDTSEVIDVPDGKDNHLGVSVRHAIKLHSCIRDKWLLFCCRSSTDKQRWLQAFAEERKLVAQDKDDGLEFPPSAKQLAKLAARCQRRPPRKPRAGKSYKHPPPTYMGSSLQLNSNSLGRKVGTWFTFGGHKKSRHRDVS
ncbi:uncharacterized protein LOC123009457 [Tribolium madens]|uniref:uncharacterized protein LOC123009457 n=1 Tax=Tribolium madens TaxID=41895 RepID=UPI001CF73104|nr:uncharacterized protein LOC123009457 [Tribolium madens]